MREKITQPHIVIPSQTDPHHWAIIGTIRRQWLQSVCPQLEIDPFPQIVGEAYVNHELGDDGTCFISCQLLAKTPNISAKIIEETRDNARQDLLIRLGSLPSIMPNRQNLDQLITQVEKSDWRFEDQFTKNSNAWKQWHRQTESYRSTPQIQEYINYAQQNLPGLKPYWEEFSIKLGN